MSFKSLFAVGCFIIFLTQLVGCKAAPDIASDDPILSYELTPIVDSEKGNSLTIDVNFKGNRDGETRIALGRAWADEQSPWSRFKDISVTGPEVKITSSLNEGILSIKHEADQNLQLTYRLHETDGRKPAGDSGYFYAPSLHDDIFHLIGWSSLAVPLPERNEAGQRTARVKLSWKNLPEDWQSAASFDIDGKTSLPLNKIFRTAISAGHFDIESRDISGKALNVVMSGDWGFSQVKFADKLQQILTALNMAWHDTPVDYQVSLLSLSNIEGGSSITGTGLNHAFAAAGTTNLELEYLTLFLTHEMTHDWIPNRIGQFPRCNDKEENCAAEIYWFSEGFTDYFSLSLLKDNNLMSQSDFMEKTNEILREYYMSPARNVSNTDIQKGFWANPDIERQPYLRGFLLALNWNQDIIDTTQNQSTMTDALRDLKDKAQQNGNPLPELTTEYLTAHFSKWTGRDVAAELKSYIEKGETIIPTPKSLGACEILSTRPSFNYDLGFDVNPSLDSGIFSGVKKTSNAYRAGLRNGMMFLRKVKGGGGDTTRPIVLAVSDADKEMEVSYLPISGNGVDVPQYVNPKNKDC